jgi:hypothetical protein
MDMLTNFVIIVVLLIAIGACGAFDIYTVKQIQNDPNKFDPKHNMFGWIGALTISLGVGMVLLLAEKFSENPAYMFVFVWISVMMVLCAYLGIFYSLLLKNTETTIQNKNLINLFYFVWSLIFGGIILAIFRLYMVFHRIDTNED